MVVTRMVFRGRRLWQAVAAGVLVLLAVTGCGSSALTGNAPTRSAASTSATRTASKPGSALTSAVAKLGLIGQDGCQTDPPERVYPACERFLAEVRSAVTTVRNNTAGLPNAAAVTATSDTVLAAADAYDHDGCGGGPYASGSPNAGRCTTDLSRVRTALSTLMSETNAVGSG